MPSPRRASPPADPDGRRTARGSTAGIPPRYGPHGAGRRGGETQTAQAAAQKNARCSSRINGRSAAGLLCPQLQDELRFIADVRQLVGEQCAAERSQPLAAGDGLERAVVDIADQLGGDQDVQIELEAGEPAYAPEQGVAPVQALRADAVLLHELTQQARVPLLLADEELGDARQQLVAVGGREAARRAQEAGAVGLLAELERGDGAADEPALLGPEIAPRAAGRAARLLGVIFEMVEPDAQIREHG